MSKPDKSEFVRELARYLAGDNAIKMGLSLATGINRAQGERWAAIRNTTPLRGHMTVEGAEELLGDWLGIYLGPPTIHLHAFTEMMNKAWRDACAKDPGLEAAFNEARARDRNIGWLEIAAKREKERNRDKT